MSSGIENVAPAKAYIVALIALIGALTVAGAGCVEENSSATAPSPSPTTSASSTSQVPVQARYWDISPPVVQVQGADTINLIDKSLENNPDFVALRTYFQSQGYSYSPTPKSYVAASDPSGRTIIGFSHRSKRSDGTYGVLVSFYPTPDANQSVLQPLYTYMTEINYLHGPNHLVWFDGKALQVVDTMAVQR